MQSLISPETFEFFARYLLAGLVFLSARSWIVTGERLRPNETLIEAVILSLINQMLWIVFFGWWDWAVAEPLSQIALIAQVVVQPVVLGLLVGWIASQDWAPFGFRRLFMPTVKPVGSVLGLALDSIQGPSFVILTFADDRIVYGYFGTNSHVRPDDQSGGMYLEAIYVVSESGQWTEVQPSRGAWVSLEGLRTFELISSEELVDDQDPV